MGTTAEKFNYAFGTKDLLKTEINKINNVLDDDSTFRSYPQELFNGYLDILNNGTDTLWNNLEKVSASGEEATLENVENAPMKMVLNGNTSQETTTGKNLFSSEMELGMINNTTGEPTASSQGIRTKDFIEVSPNTEYTISNDKDYHILIYEYDENQSFIQYVGNFLNPKTFTTSSTAKYIKLRSATSYGTETDITAKYQLEQGSTATSWEKYTGGQPSPNPDYPQEVKVVKGENVVSVSGKNLFDETQISRFGRYNAREVINDDKSMTITSTGSNGYVVIAPVQQYENGKTYTISFDVDDISKFSRVRMFINTSTPKYSTSHTNIITFTANEDEHLCFGIYPVENETITISNIQIEENSTATPYVPFSKTDYTINLGSLELCKIGNYQDYLYKSNGSWFVHKVINKHLLKPSSVSLEENGIRARYTVPIPVNTYPPAYCNYFGIATTYAQAVNSNGETPNRLNVNATGTLLCNVAGYTTTTEYIDLFANNDIYLYYPLATTTEEEITDTTLIAQLEVISNAKSVADKTYITQTNDDLPFILDVEAIKEYEVN